MDRQVFEAAWAVALHFLGYAPRSRAEIEGRLERAAFAPEVIAAVIAELEAQGGLDDARFAQAWVADRADRKKYGRQRLAAELRRKGVDKENVEEALRPLDDVAELERARAAARPKWHVECLADVDEATQQAEKRRMANFLLRRGFSWPIIAQVLAEQMANSS